MAKGQINVQTENIFPIIKQFLYSDQEIFLRELVSNASDALNKLRVKQLTDKDIPNPEEELKIKITTDKDNNIFTIEDTGIGMTQTVLDKVFKNETSFTSYGTNNEKGTGLGLSLCKEMVEKNKGTVVFS